MSWLVPVLAGAATGVLSGFGVGGGTLLLIYMTAFAGVERTILSLPHIAFRKNKADTPKRGNLA